MGLEEQAARIANSTSRRAKEIQTLRDKATRLLRSLGDDFARAMRHHGVDATPVGYVERESVHPEILRRKVEWYRPSRLPNDWEFARDPASWTGRTRLDVHWVQLDRGWLVSLSDRICCPRDGSTFQHLPQSQWGRTSNGLAVLESGLVIQSAGQRPLKTSGRVPYDEIRLHPPLQVGRAGFI